MLGLIIPVVLTQGENLSLLDIESLEQNITDSLSLLSDTIARHVPPLKNYLNELSIENQFVENIDLNFIPNLLRRCIGCPRSTLSIGFFLSRFYHFFLLKRSEIIATRNFGISFLITKKKKRLIHLEKSAIYCLVTFSGILLQLIILFIVYSITLLIGGIENAIVIALLCSIFNIIPYVGPLIGGTLMLLLTLISYLEVDFYHSCAT